MALRCEQCPFHKQSRSGFLCTNFNEGVGKKDAKVMLVYDAPFSSDVLSDRFASDDQYNTQMSLYLSRLGLKLEDVYTTSFVKCFIADKKKKPTKGIKQKCVDLYLSQEIKNIKPKVVILCGSMVTKWFLPESQTLSQIVGQSFYSNEYKTYFIPIFDLFYLANFHKQSIQARKMDKAFAKVSVLLNGKETNPNKPEKIVYFSDWDKLKSLKSVVTCDVETTGLDDFEDRIVTVGVGDNETRVVFDVSDCSGYPKILALQKEMDAARKANTDTEAENEAIKAGNKNKKAKDKLPFKSLPYTDDYIEERRKKIIEVVGQTFIPQIVAKMVPELKKRKLVFQNGLFDLKMFLRDGFDLTDSFAGDTRLLQYLIDPLGATALGFMVQLYYGVNYKEAIDRGNILDMDGDERKYYCNEDIFYTYKLFSDLYAKIKAQGSELAHGIKINLAKILAHTERRGIKIDLKKADQLVQFYTEQKTKTEKKFKDKFSLSPEFNLNSPKQLSKLLYEDLQLPVLRKTKEGNPSTDEYAINMLASRRPSLDVLVDYRTFKGHIEKLELYKRNTRADGRLRTQFDMFAQDSARLMSKKPNIQNVPRDSLYGISAKDIENFMTQYGWKPDIKGIFVAETGYCFVKYDYKAIEFRVWIELAKDPKGTEFIQSGRDIHAYIASQFYREDEALFLDKKNEPYQEKRNRVKAIVYGSMYGRTPEGIVKEHGGTIEEAEQIQRIFFSICRVGYLWMKQVEQQVMKDHHLKTPFGAHRVFPDIELAIGNKKDEILREAKSFIVQSWAAELGFIGMSRVWAKIRELGLDAFYVHQIHDAGIIEVKVEQAEKLQKIVKTCATNPYSKMKIPLDVDMKVGHSWAEVG
jgi:uracil-DNA glycosylase family 4